MSANIFLYIVQALYLFQGGMYLYNRDYGGVLMMLGFIIANFGVVLRSIA